jgi:hypothetical protein
VSKNAAERAEHIREARTGFKSGNAITARKREPRPKYDPAKVSRLEDRLSAKAEEIGISLRHIKRLKSQLENHGPRGLVDGRYTRTKKPPRVDPLVAEAIECVREELRDAGTITRKMFHGQTLAFLKRAYPDAVVDDGEKIDYEGEKIVYDEKGAATLDPSGRRLIRVPRESKFNELLVLTDHARGTFGPAKLQAQHRGTPAGAL